MQLIILLFAAFLLNACAAPGEARTQTAALAQGSSEEVSCMSDCLDDDSETCDSCAASCLDAQRGDQVALGR